MAEVFAAVEGVHHLVVVILTIVGVSTGIVYAGNDTTPPNPATPTTVITPHTTTLEEDNSSYNDPNGTRLRVLCDGTTRIYLYSEEPSLSSSAGAAIAIIPNDPRCI